MSGSLPISDKFLPLLNDACDGVLVETQIPELAAVLDSDVVARKVFIDHVSLQADLRFLGRAERICNIGLAGVRAILPEASPSLSSAPGFLSTTLHGTVGYFSSGWPVAYLVATVIFGIGLLVSAHVYVSQPVQVAKQSASLPSPLSPLPSVVGRITGMVDCKWETKGLGIRDWGLEISDLGFRISANPQSLVSLGDQFTLRSGLMEITYDTGAKVILQGPVAYEVESKDGGFLSLGKLTARLEKKGEGGRRKAEGSASLPSPAGRGAGGEGSASDPSQSALTLTLSQGARGPDTNPQSLIPNPFVVRTPTAIVTDLGTEFGVEVSKEGNTTSHVFRGLVRVQMVAADGRTQGDRPTPA